MITELKEGVFWVGAPDWELRSFHGHELSTRRGSTYNAYLILDERNVLIETVWSPHADRLIDAIREIIDPSEIDLIIANHAEPDHAGALATVKRYAPDAEIITSKRGAASIEGYHHASWPLKTVGTGERISIGRRELVFIEAPMLHWPDSMFTYLTGSNILFSNDAFGQHYCTAFRFDDLVDERELFEEALRYYANILTPFSDLVLKKIDEVLSLGLPVDMIAPSHGIIWRGDPLRIVGKYREWAEQKGEARVLVVYDSMWNATRRMADAIGEGVAETGIPCVVANAAANDRNDLLVEVFRSKCIVIGSSTINNRILPTLAPLLEDMRGLKFKNKLGAAFGSYGWSGESVRILEEHFAACSIPLVRPGIRCKWQPGPDDIASCRAFGRELGERTRGEFSAGA